MVGWGSGPKAQAGRVPHGDPEKSFRRWALGAQREAPSLPEPLTQPASLLDGAVCPLPSLPLQPSRQVDRKIPQPTPLPSCSVSAWGSEWGFPWQEGPFLD